MLRKMKMKVIIFLKKICKALNAIQTNVLRLKLMINWNRLWWNVRRETLGLFSTNTKTKNDEEEISMEWSFIMKPNDKVAGRRRNRSVFFVFSMISGIIWSWTNNGIVIGNRKKWRDGFSDKNHVGNIVPFRLSIIVKRIRSTID